MHIEVTVVGFLREELPAEYGRPPLLSLSLEEPVSVHALVGTLLGIRESDAVVFVNDRAAPPDRLLRDGDRVTVHSPIAGG
jgi:sulfur carrier protein ThiS